jgi:hypothetical protein
MAQFQISYGVGGGYNDIREEIIDADNLKEAVQIAYEKSVEVFESYGIYEDQDMTHEYDEFEYQDSIERWVDYYAKSV